VALVNPHLQSASPALTAGASNAIAADTARGFGLPIPTAVCCAARNPDRLSRARPRMSWCDDPASASERSDR